MKKFLLQILILLFIGNTFNTYSQEWKWRDSTFSQLKQRVLNQTEYFEDTLKDRVDFRKSKFTSTASFILAKFNSTTDFDSTQFQSKVYFNYAEFDSIANFENTLFASHAEFQNTKFHSKVFFSDQFFESKIDFQGATFDSEVFFDSTWFGSIAEFKFAKFNSLAKFQSSQFDTIVYFNHAIFHSQTDFQLAHFNSSVVFRHAKFKGKTFFTYTTLPRYLDFSRVTEIESEIDFTMSLIDSICNINLISSEIEKFRFRYTRFKLWFPENDSINYELKSSIYEDLLKKQKDEGFTQSYEKLDKEYREFQYTDPGAGKGAWGKFLNWVDKNWWGYGYDKELIIRNALLIFLILSFINSFFLKYLITQVYSNEKISKLIEKRETKNGVIRWFDSLRYSIFYTAVIFFSFNFDMDKLNYAGNLDGWKVLNLTWFMLIYLGGVVCMAYLANFIISV